MNYSIRKATLILFSGCVLMLLTECFRYNTEGACAGTSEILDNTYCYDSWTHDECQEWDDLEINGANWNYYAGQTCRDVGIEPNNK